MRRFKAIGEEPDFSDAGATNPPRSQSPLYLPYLGKVPSYLHRYNFYRQLQPSQSLILTGCRVNTINALKATAKHTAPAPASCWSALAVDDSDE